MHSSLSNTSMSSMTDQLSNINFRFEELCNQMTQFSQIWFLHWERQKQDLEERNQFHINLTELHDMFIAIFFFLTLILMKSKENQHMKQKDIEILTLKFQIHTQTLQKETAEWQKCMHAAIAAITSQHDSQLATCDCLKLQIDETQKTINQRLKTQKAHARHLDSQAHLSTSELKFWQNYLCLWIERSWLS